MDWKNLVKDNCIQNNSIFSRGTSVKWKLYHCHTQRSVHTRSTPSYCAWWLLELLSLRVAASGLTDTSKSISLNLWISQPVWYFFVSHILLGGNICFPFPPFTCLDCKHSVSSIRTWPTQREDSQPAQSHPVSEADQSHLAPSHHERYRNPWLTQVLAQSHEVTEPLWYVPLEKQELALTVWE